MSIDSFVVRLVFIHYTYLKVWKLKVLSVSFVIDLEKIDTCFPYGIRIESMWQSRTEYFIRNFVVAWYALTFSLIWLRFSLHSNIFSVTIVWFSWAIFKWSVLPFDVCLMKKSYCRGICFIYLFNLQKKTYFITDFLILVSLQKTAICQTSQIPLSKDVSPLLSSSQNNGFPTVDKISISVLLGFQLLCCFHLHICILLLGL